MGDSTKESIGAGDDLSQTLPPETPTQKEQSPATTPLRSDTSSKASKKSRGSANSGSQLNGYPSQISYNANTASNGHGNHFRMQSPPPISTITPGSNGSYQINDPVPGGYPPPHLQAYQMSSSPVILTGTHGPSGNMYSPAGVNYPMQMLSHNVGGGLPPTSPSMQFQPQDTNGSNHVARNAGNTRNPHRRSNSYNGPMASSTYGSATQAFFSPPGSGAPPLPRSRGSKNGTPGSGDRTRAGSADFSPVNEVRRLTGTGGSSRQPISPKPRSVRAHNRAKSEDWQGNVHPQMFPGHQGMNLSPLYQQQQQQPQPVTYNRGVYMGGDFNDDSLRGIHGNGMTGSIRSNSSRKNSEDDGSDGGGEAVFLVNKSSSRKRSTRRKSGTKKRHMRQRSAQLFMEEIKGTEQIPRCRDIVFLLLFVFHLLGIVYLGRTYGDEAFTIHDESPEDSESSVTIIFTNLIYIAGLSGVFAMVVSGLTLLLMTGNANKVVQIALVLSITFSFVWGTMGIGLSPQKIVPITGIIALTLSVAYAFMVWDRIPFAAANLHAGLSGILANPGTVFVTFGFQVLALGWSIYYIYVGGGVYDAIQVGDICDFDDDASRNLQYIIYGLLGISYYWTLNVFLNIIQVTVADVIGRWWYTMDGDTSSRGVDLHHAFFRSSFYSIGSICFGSLLVGPIRVLRQFSIFFRPAEEVNSLMTLHECMHCIQSGLTNCVESLARRFSPWSFTYVGLYGYNIMDAGSKSAELFEKRGWTTIVSDELVPNVLFLITLAITGLSGVFAHFLQQFESLSLTATNDPLVTPFIVGALVGLVVSSVLFGIISSSVNAVIVLFAASPVDFEQNHPDLSEEMRNAWREVWPGCMDIMDVRHQVGGFYDPSMNGSFRGIPPEMYGPYNPSPANGSIRSQSERHPLLR